MEKYKLLYRCYGMLDAKSIQILLESFNIKSRAFQESAGVALGLTVGGLGSANIYVKNEDFENGQKIITLMENGELEVPDIDPENLSQMENDEDFDDLEILEESEILDDLED